MSSFRQSASGPAKTLAVAGTPVSFVAGDFTGARMPYARMQVQGDAVYATYDGTTPSAANGEILIPGNAGYFTREDVLAMKFIQVNTAAKIFAQPCDLISPANG